METNQICSVCNSARNHVTDAPFLTLEVCDGSRTFCSVACQIVFWNNPANESLLLLKPDPDAERITDRLRLQRRCRDHSRFCRICDGPPAYKAAGWREQLNIRLADWSLGSACSIACVRRWLEACDPCDAKGWWTRHPKDISICAWCKEMHRPDWPKNQAGALRIGPLSFCTPSCALSYVAKQGKESCWQQVSEHARRSRRCPCRKKRSHVFTVVYGPPGAPSHFQADIDDPHLCSICSPECLVEQLKVERKQFQASGSGRWYSYRLSPLELEHGALVTYSPFRELRHVAARRILNARKSA